jgi:hypothetical protein
MEITPGFLDISGNLVAQGFDGGELDFVAETLQKENLHFRVRF